MSKERAGQLVDAGIWLKLSGDLVGAKRLFERALKLDPDNEKAKQLLEGTENIPSSSSSSVSVADPFERAPGDVPPSIPPVTPSLDDNWGRLTGTQSPPPQPAPPPSLDDNWGGLTGTRSPPPQPAPTPGAPFASSSSNVVLGEPAGKGTLVQYDAPPPPSAPSRGEPITIPRGTLVEFSSPSVKAAIAAAKAKLAAGEAPVPQQVPEPAPKATQQMFAPGTPEPPKSTQVMFPSRPQQIPKGTQVMFPERGATKLVPDAPPGLTPKGPARSMTPAGELANTIRLGDDEVPTIPNAPAQTITISSDVEDSLPQATPPMFTDAPDPLAGGFDSLPPAPDPAFTPPPMPSAPPADATEAWSWSGTPSTPAPESVADLWGDVPVPRPSPSLTAEAQSAWDARSNPGIKLDTVEGADRTLDMLSSDSRIGRSVRDKREETKALLRGARDLLDLDDHTGAMELILKAQQLSPDDPDVQQLREKSEATLLAMFESKLGGLEKIPRVLLKDDEIIWLNLDHRAGFVLAQIDGTVTFDDLFAVSGMSRLDTARILAQLVDEGVISRG